MAGIDKNFAQDDWELLERLAVKREEQFADKDIADAQDWMGDLYKSIGKRDVTAKTLKDLIVLAVTAGTAGAGDIMAEQAMTSMPGATGYDVGNIVGDISGGTTPTSPGTAATGLLPLEDMIASLMQIGKIHDIGVDPKATIDKRQYTRLRVPMAKVEREWNKKIDKAIQDASTDLWASGVDISQQDLETAFKGLADWSPSTKT